MRALPVVFVLALLGLCCEKSNDLFFFDVADPLEGGMGIEMVTLSGGAFQMGSNARPAFRLDTVDIGKVDTIFNVERPVHWVTVTAFTISIMEITQEQYRGVMGTNPSRFAGETDLPVENVSWKDAVTFCNKLSERTKLDPCYDLETWKCDFTRNGFRLPTEAEWEYACRAGVTKEPGEDNPDVSQYWDGWYISNSSHKTHPVGFRLPSPVGLYDLRGNVWEWCNDYFARYHCNSEFDPTGPESGAFRIMRGGSWASSPGDCSPSNRRWGTPDYTTSQAGFRVVRR